MTEIRETLAFGEREPFAEALGLTVAMLGYYERGDRVPDADALAPYRQKFGVNLGWLVTGLGQMFEQAPGVISQEENFPAQADVQEHEAVRENVDAVIIGKLDSVLQQIAKLSAENSESKPRVSQPVARPPATVTYLPFRASAGGGSVVLDDNPGFQLDLDELLQRIMGMRRKNVRLIEIIGDSMLPTFVSGDVVVADTSFPRRDTLPDDGEIYVIRKDGELLVKRARWVDADALEWASDNLEFAPIRVERDDLNHVKMVGKVIWLWRRAL